MLRGGSSLLDTELIFDKGNNYIRYNSGLLICFGYGDNGSTVTFGKAFKDTNFTAVLGINTYTGVDGMGADILSTKTRTTTTMRLGAYNGKYQGIVNYYICIGYWK